MDIGRKFLNLRKDQNIAQRTLAYDANVTPSALSRTETGIHVPKGPMVFALSRLLGITADYVLDETIPYPPPAYELLANLVDTTKDEPRDQPTMVSARELRIIEAFRGLELERKRLLEAALGGTRPEVRLAAWVLGAELPGEDPTEVARFRDRLLAMAHTPDDQLDAVRAAGRPRRSQPGPAPKSKSAGRSKNAEKASAKGSTAKKKTKRATKKKSTKAGTSKRTTKKTGTAKKTTKRTTNRKPPRKK